MEDIMESLTAGMSSTKTAKSPRDSVCPSGTTEDTDGRTGTDTQESELVSGDGDGHGSRLRYQRETRTPKRRPKLNQPPAAQRRSSPTKARTRKPQRNLLALIFPQPRNNQKTRRPRSRPSMWDTGTPAETTTVSATDSEAWAVSPDSAEGKVHQEVDHLEDLRQLHSRKQTSQLQLLQHQPQSRKKSRRQTSHSQSSQKT